MKSLNLAENTRLRAILAMLLVSICYGCAGLTSRTLQEDLKIWQQLALTNGSACLLIFVIGKYTLPGSFPKALSREQSISIFGRAIFGRLVSSYLFIQACLNAPLSNVGWLSVLPFSVLLAWLFFSEQVSSREVKLIVVSLLGASLITTPKLALDSALGMGELFAISSCLFSSLGYLLGRRTLKDLDIRLATFWISFVTACIAACLAIIFEGGFALPSSDKYLVLLLTVLMVVLGMSGALYGYIHLPASVATGILSLETVWSGISGFLIYAEIPSSLEILGGFLIVLSAYYISSVKKKQVECTEMKSCFSSLEENLACRDCC